MFVTKQKADKGECKNSVYKLPLCAASTKREVEKNREKGRIHLEMHFLGSRK